MRDGWVDGWRQALDNPPGQWWQATHITSGYVVGEVDAGRYMVKDRRGNGLVDDTGDYVVFDSTDQAMEHVENVVANAARQ